MSNTIYETLLDELRRQSLDSGNWTNFRPLEHGKEVIGWDGAIDIRGLADAIGRYMQGNQIERIAFTRGELIENFRVKQIEIWANYDGYILVDVERERARAWDECAQAAAWALDHGTELDAVTYVHGHNPYKEASE